MMEDEEAVELARLPLVFTAGGVAAFERLVLFDGELEPFSDGPRLSADDADVGVGPAEPLPRQDGRVDSAPEVILQSAPRCLPGIWAMLLRRPWCASSPVTT